MRKKPTMTAKFCKQLFLLLVVTIATICSFFQFGEKVSFDNNNSRPTDPSALNSSAPFHCHRYMTVNTAGRLGNKISEYSTLLTNAIQYKYRPVITTDMKRAFRGIFPFITIPSEDEDEQYQVCYPNRTDAKWTHVELNNIDHFRNSSENLFITGFPNDLEKIRLHFHLLRQELRFHSKFLDRAKQYTRDAKAEYLRANNLTLETRVSFVGVHARRTDYFLFLSNKYRGVLVTAAYFKTAMQRMRSELRKEGKMHVIFIMASDDITWGRNHLSSQDDIYFVPKHFIGFNRDEKAVLDLAILSQCNHSIITYGTYGLWSAILAGGRTIVADGNLRRDTPTIIQNLPSNWTALKDPCINQELRQIC